MDFAVPADHRIKLKESEKKDKYLDLFIKGTGGLGKKRTGGDHSNYNIFENGPNTEKCPGDIRKIAVTQIPEKDHQLTL